MNLFLLQAEVVIFYFQANLSNYEKLYKFILSYADQDSDGEASSHYEAIYEAINEQQQQQSNHSNNLNGEGKNIYLLYNLVQGIPRSAFYTSKYSF